MGPDQKPTWAVGPDGDTSKNLVTDSPKTLQEATKYLYFDDMPTDGASQLGSELRREDEYVRRSEERTSVREAEPETPELEDSEGEDVPTHDAELGAASHHSKSDDLPEATAESGDSFSSRALERLEALRVAAAPHQGEIISGVAVLGFVAAVMVIRRRRSRHVREAELDSAGVAEDREFAPLLIRKRSSAAPGGYGAM